MCPLCTCEQTTRLFESGDRVHGIPGVFTSFQCFHCKAVFYEPRLHGKELADFYPENYGPYRYSRKLARRRDTGIRRFVLENYYGYPSVRAGVSTRWKREVAWLCSLVMAKNTIPYRGDGRFLDVGCGGGSYLYRLKNLGWDVYGVDPSSAAVSQARSLGLRVCEGRLEDAKFPDTFFDVIRLNHVLEHLPNPLESLREVGRVLKADGLIYVTVPNTGSLNYWLFGRNWYALDVPRHVISYDPRTLKYLCERGGMEIIRIRYRSGPFNFVRSVKYFLEEEGRMWPSWLRAVDWPSNKAIRRFLRPFFLLVDLLRLGDTLVVTLQKARR